jgi:phenylalanyl-tRNA synthetase alpha chain
MENHKPPFAIIVPGKVFRNEATDATHEAQFYQVEGLMVGEDVSLANLKWMLEEFFKRFLGKGSEIRFRPSYFPFVEPGVEVDLRTRTGADQTRTGADKEKWLEVVGAGMVHPNVLKNVNIDSKKYQGFAFGMGLDRLMIIKYGIPDIRFSYQGDLRLNQF